MAKLFRSTLKIKVQLWVDIHVKSKFIPDKLWQQTNPTIKEMGKLFSSTHTADALDKVNKPLIFAKLKQLKSCLKTANINLELKGCSMSSILCNAFSCQKFFT